MAKNKPFQRVIAIDIDEVMQPMLEPLLRHHNEMYGTKFQYPDPHGRYFLQHYTQDSVELTDDKLLKYVDTAAFKATPPLAGAIEAIVELKARGYTLIVVTARQTFFRAATIEFLEQRFPQAFHGVHFIPHFLGSQLQPGEAKLKICLDNQAAYLIDDNLGSVEKAAAAGIKTILFGDYHWNQAEKLPEGVRRCKDWAAVMEYFDER